MEACVIIQKFTLASAILLLVSGLVIAEEGQSGFKPARPAASESATAAEKSNSFEVPVGTRILLNMVNSVSTRNAAVGDRLYLETAFPVLSKGVIIVPPGSWVNGTVTQVKRPGRVKGKGELYVSLDSLTLPNGVTRDFRSRIGSLDGRASEKLDRGEGKVKSDGSKGADAATVARTTASGAGTGTLIGLGAGNIARGAAIGSGAGTAAGLIAVLLTRGPDATLYKGTTLEMVLDRPLEYSQKEVQFDSSQLRSRAQDGPGPQQPQTQRVGGWSPF